MFIIVCILYVHVQVLFASLSSYLNIAIYTRISHVHLVIHEGCSKFFHVETDIFSNKLLRQTLANPMFISSGTCCHAILPVHALYNVQIKAFQHTHWTMYICHIYIFVNTYVHIATIENWKCLHDLSPKLQTKSFRHVRKNTFSRGYSNRMSNWIFPRDQRANKQVVETPTW